MRTFTIGFTKKPAQRFFELLRNAGVKRVLDVRLHNSSQLAGFAKRDDLAWFLREVVHARQEAVVGAHIRERADDFQIRSHLQTPVANAVSDAARHALGGVAVFQIVGVEVNYGAPAARAMVTGP